MATTEARGIATNFLIKCDEQQMKDKLRKLPVTTLLRMQINELEKKVNELKIHVRDNANNNHNLVKFIQNMLSDLATGHPLMALRARKKN